MPPYDLTDEQWAILQPFIPPPAPPGSRGRPPIDERAVLNGVFWKLRTASPWYDMPPCYPSHQTCYRRYRRWRHTGLLDDILRALADDLRRRGDLDIRALNPSDLTFERHEGKWVLRAAPRFQDTWQFYTALLIIQVAIRKKRRASPRLFIEP